MTLLVRDAEVVGQREHVDVRIDGERITSVESSIECPPSADVIDANGGAVLPGLHDHHVHLLAWAAALTSVPCGPPAVTDHRALTRALRAAAAGPDAWIRGVGYHESVAGELDRDTLDAVVADRPVRVQHRSGILWMLNSAALRELHLGNGDAPTGLERDARGRPTGRCWDADRWLRTRLPPRPLDLGVVGRHLAAYGVTAVTDATATSDSHAVGALERAVVSGRIPQRVHMMGPADLLLPEGSPLALGAVKVVLREANLPALADTEAVVGHARACGRPVAFHCTTRVELVFALAVLDGAGSDVGDRIEHGGIIPRDLHVRLRAHALTVVTQPNFVAERGDTYLREVEAADLPWLYPCASLRAAGMPVAAGTDAPFGCGDPWRAIEAAQRRQTHGGTVVGGHERVDGRVALGLFLGRARNPGGTPRRVVPGAPADLCVLRVPRSAALAVPDADNVATTIVAGSVVYPP